MRYQRLLGREMDSWLKLQISLGKSQGPIEYNKRNFLTFLKSFSDEEKREIEGIVSSQIPHTIHTFPINKTNVRLLLIKKYIETYNPLLIAEYMRTGLTGKELEKFLFITIARNLFLLNTFPEDSYSYCIFRRKGSPTTWFALPNGIPIEEVKRRIDQKIDSLCRRLTSRFHKKRSLKMCQQISGYILYLIEKSSRVEVLRTEKKNIEIQRVIDSILVVDTENNKIGYSSYNKKEIYEVQKYLKQNIFSGQIFTPRNDVQYDSKELFQKLLTLDEELTNLKIIGLKLDNPRLPNHAKLSLESHSGESIKESILLLKPLWEEINITDLNNIRYSFNSQKVKVYSYGDYWKRRFFNIETRGKARFVELMVLQKLQYIIGKDIKETRFIIQPLTLEEIIKKLLDDKSVPIDLSVPEVVDKTIVDLVKQKLLKQPKYITKRRCIRWECSQMSWVDLICPNCRSEMVVIGENIIIEIAIKPLLKQLTNYIQRIYPNFEITKQVIQRNKFKKDVIRILNKDKYTACYIIPIFTNKDFKFLETLTLEGYGTISICDPQMSSKKDAIDALGGDVIDLSHVILGLKKNFNGESTDLKFLIKDKITSQEDKMLERIYSKLQESKERLKNKNTGYNEEIFEIDIKNIIQALVPNVVRLGTKFKGKKVPDGYCCYKPIRSTYNRLFGWDAKYSITNNYSLNKRDLKKQRGYIEWLTTDPEPKSLGKLRIYCLISNFSSISGFKTVLSKLRRCNEKPRLCRIILIQDKIMQKLAGWILQNWQKVIEKGPEIAIIFFKWLVFNKRKMYSRWIYCSESIDWSSLEAELNAI